MYSVLNQSNAYENGMRNKVGDPEHLQAGKEEQGAADMPGGGTPSCYQ